MFMRSILTVCLFLCGQAARAQSDVAAFSYKLSMRARPTTQRPNFISTKSFVLEFSATSLKIASSEGPFSYTSVKTTTTLGGPIDVVAVQQATVSDEMRFPRQEGPENTFQFDLKPFVFPADGVIPLRIHFQNCKDEFVLRHDGKTIRLEATNALHGRVDSAEVPFVTLEAREGEEVYQCTPWTISARGKWRTHLLIHGQPASLKVLDKVLFITTTGKHSFYLLKETGDVLIYHHDVLPGNDPVAETLELGEKMITNPNKDDRYFKEDRILSRYFRTGVVLNDRRVIPFLINSIEHGMGLGDKCLAVAGLEKFNGDPTAWTPAFPKQSIYKRVAMGRVFPESANRAEQAKWREVFREDLADGNH